jgi:predicted dehydrogenase
VSAARSASTDPVRVGVIGVGDFGQRHIAAYRRQPGVEVVGVADSNARRAASVAARWGIERWFVDGEELIATCRPVGVSIATPGRHHLAPTLAALDHACSVLLEKPIAMSSEETATIGTAVAISNAFVVPAHVLRFAAPHVAMRERVRSGQVGRLIGISARRDRGSDHLGRFPDVHPALMTMIHDIDLALWVTGSRALRVSARGRGGEPDRPILVWAQVEAADGTIWSLRTAWVLPDDATPVDEFQAYGVDGTSEVAVRQDGATTGRRDGERLGRDSLTDALDAEIAHFCSCLRRGTPSDVIPLADADHGIRVAQAIVASAAAGGATTEVVG